MNKERDWVWQDDSACAKEGIHVDDFFPEVGVAVHNTVKMICRSCPVQEQCLAYALSIPDLQGYWAGTYYKDRQRARANARKLAASV